MRFSTEAKVGVVVLLALMALSYMTFTIGELRFGEDGYHVSVVFSDTEGLAVMAPVRIAGVDVGKVEKIELIGKAAKVTLRIKSGVEVPQGSAAALISSGVLGDRFVGIRLGTGKTVLKEGDPLEAVSSGIGMEHLSNQASDLMQKFSEVAENIRVITDSLRDVLGTNEGKQSMQDILTHVKSLTSGINGFISNNRDSMGRSVTNFENFSSLLKNEGEGLLMSLTRITQKIESNEGTLGKLIQDKALYEKLDLALRDFNGAAEGIQKITNQVQRGEGTLGKLVYDEAVYDKLNSTLKDLNQVLQDVQGVTKKVQSGEGSLGKLFTDDSAYRNLNTALEKVSNTLGRIERFQTEVGAKDEYQQKGNENKGYVSIKLFPHPDKYYLLEVIDDPYGKTVLTSRLTTTDGLPRTQTELETQRKLKFSALMGKRFYPFGLRAGLMESSFGMGGDIYALNDKIRLSLDIWDFSSDDPLSEDPHLKLSAEYDPWHKVYLTAGWDQILNTERQTAFVGAGLRFTDDDLKYLIGIAGIAR